jgi:transcriptional regulator with XRE-family HTH domain
MSNHDETGGTEDPRSLIDQLRRDLAEPDADDQVLPTEPTENELWGEQHLRDVELGYPASVMAGADAVIPPREPSLEARARMIKAADKALAERRVARGLLPIVLRWVRQQAGITTSEVASRAGLSEETVKALEAGERAVDRYLATDEVAQWINASRVERDQAVSALRKSLQSTWRYDQVLAAGSTEVPANVEAYVERVVRKLEQLAQEGSQ